MKNAEPLEIRMKSAYLTLLIIRRLRGPHVKVFFGTYQTVERAMDNVRKAARREGIKL